jgi:tetratricopeptide (TPR) repeat protein
MFKKTWIFHPFLFAAYPILFYYEQNKHEIKFSKVLLPLSSSLLVAVVFFLFFNLLLKEKHKAGVLSTCSLLLFFFYEAFIKIIAKFSLSHWILEFDPNLYFLSILILVGTFYFLRKSTANFAKLSPLLNVFTFILFLFPIISLINYKLDISKISDSLHFKKAHIELPVSSDKKKPDIYYIVLDSYAREDIFKDFYNFNNSEFIQFLKEKGFYIGNKSRSNYPVTASSLSSTLNMDFVATHKANLEAGKSILWPLLEDLEDNLVMRFLKKQGYKYIHFNSDVGVTDSNKNADLEMTPPDWLSLFVTTFAQRTFLKTFNFNMLNSLKIRQKTLLYTFDKLKDIPKKREPTFTFAHILMPHEPFAFDRNGNTPKGSNAKGLNAYLEFVRFANIKVKNLIENLISQSDVQPLIILQSDHGSDQLGICTEPSQLVLNEKMSILNAYFVPDEIKNELYEEITPVNTFRIIFNKYFGADLKLLEDKVFFTYCYGSTYQPVRVPDEKYLPSDLKEIVSTKKWIESLDDSISQFPDNTYLRNSIGIEYLKNRDYKNAERHLRLGLKFKNDEVTYLIYKNLGIALRAQNKFLEAVNAFKVSLDLDSNRLETMFLLAEVYVADSKYQKAKPYLDKLSLLGLNWDKLNRLRAIYFSAIDDNDNAIREYRKILSINFQDAEVHFKMGSSYDEVKNGRKAIFHTIIAGQLFAGTNNLDMAKSSEKKLEMLLAKYKFKSSDFSHVRVDKIPSNELD